MKHVIPVTRYQHTLQKAEEEPLPTGLFAPSLLLWPIQQIIQIFSKGQLSQK